jgi:hypothetical protein
MRNANRRYIVRGFEPDTGDVQVYQTDDLERAQDMAKQMAEDLEDMQFIDRRGKSDAAP